MGSRDTQSEFLNFSVHFSSRKQQQIKMSEAEAKDAFIIFDEAYEGNDVDGFYVGDILRALGCNVTNAAVVAAGGAAKADTSSTGCKEDYIEGLKVFDKDGAGKVPLPEVLNLLDLKADEEDMISYMDLIDKLLAATA